MLYGHLSVAAAEATVQYKQNTIILNLYEFNRIIRRTTTGQRYQQATVNGKGT